MSQHDNNIANGSGATVRADLNNALQAIAECQSGASAPGTTFAYQFWADTTNGILKQRNGANTAWIEKGLLADVLESIRRTGPEAVTHNFASDANYTLTSAQEGYGRIILTDTGILLTTGRNVVVSTTERGYIFQNDTAQTLTIKTSGGSGIALPAGSRRELHCDGTNVVEGIMPVVSQAVAEAGTSTVPNSWTAQRVAQAIAALASSSPISESYTSSQQTITDGGSLTLAHGLSSTPYLVLAYLICIDAGGDLNYSQDDVVLISPDAQDGAANRGLSIVPDATNINIRYASGSGNALYLINKSTGLVASITNTKWELIIRAWA